MLWDQGAPNTAMISHGGHSRLVVFSPHSGRGFNITPSLSGEFLDNSTAPGLDLLRSGFMIFFRNLLADLCLMTHMRTICNATAQVGGMRPKFF